VKTGKRLPAFQAPLSSWGPEDESSTILRNVANLLPSDTS